MKKMSLFDNGDTNVNMDNVKNLLNELRTRYPDTRRLNDTRLLTLLNSTISDAQLLYVLCEVAREIAGNTYQSGKRVFKSWKEIIAERGEDIDTPYYAPTQLKEGKSHFQISEELDEELTELFDKHKPMNCTFSELKEKYEFGVAPDYHLWDAIYYPTSENIGRTLDTSALVSIWDESKVTSRVSYKLYLAMGIGMNETTRIVLLPFDERANLSEVKQHLIEIYNFKTIQSLIELKSFDSDDAILNMSLIDRFNVY